MNLKKLLTLLIIVFSFNISAEVKKPNTAYWDPEKVVFKTKYGYLVFTLYPAVAPKTVAQFKELVKAGAYESTYIFRYEENFVLQFTDIQNRLQGTFSDKEAKLNKRLPLELKDDIRHTKGSLSLARFANDPNSGTSSFSILLNDAPHLDGQHTVFGHLHSGGNVINKITSLANETDDGKLPPIEVLGAGIIKDEEKFFKAVPVSSINDISHKNKVIQAFQKKVIKRSFFEEFSNVLAAIFFLIFLLPLLTYFYYDKLTKRQIYSMSMSCALIAGIGFVIASTTLAVKGATYSILIVAGIIGMVKFMNRFESMKEEG